MRTTHTRPGVDASALSRSSRDNERCAVPNCNGFLIFPTDGNGRLLAYCAACEERVRQVQTRFIAVRPRETEATPVAAPTVPRSAVAVQDLTDAQLERLLRDRLISFGDACKTFQLPPDRLTKGLRSGKLRGLVNRTRCYFLFRRSLEAWHTQKRGSATVELRREKLPRSAEDALTAKELQAASPTSLRWDVWLTSHRHEPWLQRRPVSRPGARRPEYAYWSQEEA